MKIPRKSHSKKSVFSMLEKYRSGDIDWRAGKTWGYVYDPGRKAEEVSKKAYMMFLSENALDPTVYPSVLRIENELVGMVASHVGGNSQVVGNFTSGGTESLILAVKTARDYFREKRPEIKEPEMILPVTGHASFHKAGHYLGVKPVQVGVDPSTYKANVEEMRKVITPNTILLIGSAPSYAHGVVDPIREIGELALERGLLFHVDACIGGFLLPYFKRLGVKVTDFDFSVPGVTSISVDLHKYAYAAKGASIILYKTKELRRHQIFSCAKWTGYSVVNTTVQSTKSGGPMAAAWALIHFIGDKGYLDLARKKLEAVQKIIKGIEEIKDLRVLGNPEMSLIAFTSDTVSVFHIIDEMKVKGWYLQPQLGFGGSKENIHLSVNISNVEWVDSLIEDLKVCVEKAKKLKSGELASTVRDAISSVSPSELTNETFTQMLEMAGIKGVKLPKRMADINEVLNALPAELRERILIEFVNDMFSLRV